MTETMMNFRSLLEKAPDADILREMIGFAAERLMELEVKALTGAGHGEKSSLRLAQCNGYRDRDWETAPGPATCGSGTEAAVLKLCALHPAWGGRKIAKVLERRGS